MFYQVFFADFKKGFDLIDHVIFLSKLSKYEIHNCLIRWIASFLHERSQVTRIGTTFSCARTLRGGVPQGTKLGPLLFAVMVNDLVSAWAPRAKYVDDLTVIEIIPRNSPSVLNYIVNDINSYACQNNMRLNPRKCKVLTVDFLHYNSCVPMPIMVGGSLVEQVPSFKLLGVHVSEDLTWTVHIDWLVKRANRRLFALRQLRKCGVPPKDIVAIYCALVRSILEYASVVFADLPKYLDNALEDVQKRALSIIWPDLPYEHTLEKAAIQTLSARRAGACERFICKIRPGHPLYPHIHERVLHSTTQMCLRSGKSSHRTLVRTERFKNFVTVKYQPV